MHRAPLFFLVALLALFTASSASAQTPAPPGTDGPATFAGCHLAQNQGIDPVDAETAAHLVCSEIVQAGAHRGARYGVTLGRLGALVIVTVDRERDTPGVVADSRTMTLQGIEEIRVAAPRLADAIVHGTPIVETRTVDNVVADEARTRLTLPGKTHVGFGLAGAFAPYEGLGVAPALLLDVHYTMSQTEITAGVRSSTPPSWESRASEPTSSTTTGFIGVSIGGRYFTSNRELSPYVGGGLAYSYFRLAVPSGFDGNASGFGAYVDAGVEVLRIHGSHLAIGGRFDLPFFSLNEGMRFWVQPGTPNPPDHVYFAPFSVEARLTF